MTCISYRKGFPLLIGRRGACCGVGYNIPLKEHSSKLIACLTLTKLDWENTEPKRYQAREVGSLDLPIYLSKLVP